MNHGKFSLDPFLKKSNIVWFNPLTHEKEITVFTDHFLDINLVRNYPSKLKIILIMEPLETGVWSYREISRVEPFVDVILTFDDFILSKYRKAKPYIPGGTFMGSTEFIPSDKAKNRLISIVASKKKDTFGHNLRHEIVDRFNPEFKIDTFGTGYVPFEKRFEPYANYAFTIVIENVKNRYLLTEKLVDPILHKTVPIYWGGDVKNNFDPNGIITFTTLEELREVLRDISFEKYNKLRNLVNDNQIKALDIVSKELNIEKRIRENVSQGLEEKSDSDNSNLTKAGFLNGEINLQSLGDFGDPMVAADRPIPGVKLEKSFVSRLKFWIKRRFNL